MDLTERLDAMEAAIRKPSFRQSSGKANEVNYWIFDYPPEKELEVRERIEYMKHKNSKGTDGFELVVFDLYDIIIDFLEGKNFIEKCCEFEKKRGIQDRKSTRLNSSHVSISYAVFCLKKKNTNTTYSRHGQQMYHGGGHC